jgi:hypothetical protein
VPIDFKPYEGVLPYASELYGIYQPLLGWKSRRTNRRIAAGLRAFKGQFVANLPLLLAPDVDISGPLDPREVRFRVGIARQGPSSSPLLKMAPQSLIARRVLNEIQNEGPDRPEAWQRYTSQDFLEASLRDLEDEIKSAYNVELRRAHGHSRELDDVSQRRLLHAILSRESVAAGVLSSLGQRDEGRYAMNMLGLVKRDYLDEAIGTFDAITAALDPRRSELARAVISPIGIVHLFRQYFFEFDSFLGPAVEHLWLSPGGQVELVEVSTRKTIVEKLTETAVESMGRMEKTLAVDDELSEAVRRQNSSSTKFGVSVNTESSFSLGSIFTAEINTGTTYNLETNQQEARESLHRAARHQTEHIATEMKRSFRSTFRTVSETTDTRSRKYVIQNNTEELMNYELRRKMRQVGVQLQDYGTFVCWQTYVDRPGDQLGVANLVHIAVPNDMPLPIQPELPAEPQAYKGETIKHHFRWPLSDQDAFSGLDPEHFGDVVAGHFPIVPSPGFKLDRVEVKIVHGESWGFFARGLAGSERPVGPGTSEKTHATVELIHPPNVPDNPGPRQPLTDAHPEFDFEITPFYTPSDWLLAQVADEKDKKIKEANQAQEREYKEKMYAAIKERVELASNVRSRPFDELREEERIIVYRNLIRQLMVDTGVTTSEPRLQHVFAEIVQSMFDVDKMLYFVAPEWWMPQDRGGSQDIFRPEASQGEFTTYSTVSWGGGKGVRDDNYYITEKSAEAKLGSSLGWVLQLDGDNLRNAFLNAPWVKAVIPIRPGKEQRALGWLQGANVEGSDGLDAAHEASTGDLEAIRSQLGLASGTTVTLRHAIEALIARLNRRQAIARSKVMDGGGAELDYLPMDQVYERGFDPLKGGFKIPPEKDFEIFDQWVEVVPTDQIVPVPVKYDPKTGRLQ